MQMERKKLPFKKCYKSEELLLEYGKQMPGPVKWAHETWLH